MTDSPALLNFERKVSISSSVISLPKDMAAAYKSRDVQGVNSCWMTRSVMISRALVGTARTVIDYHLSTAKSRRRDASVWWIRSVCRLELLLLSRKSTNADRSRRVRRVTTSVRTKVTKVNPAENSP